MAAPIQVTKASEITASTAQTDGMVRKGAIIDKSSISASGTLLKLHGNMSSIHLSPFHSPQYIFRTENIGDDA